MGPAITSLQNPRIKSAVKLRDRRGRIKQDRIVIDGAREISRAWASEVGLVEVFVCEALCVSQQSQETLGQLCKAGIELIPVTPAVLQKLSFGSRAEGLVAVARMPRNRLQDLVLPDNALVAVLDGIEKPGNMGAVARTADGAGLSALVVADPGTDLYNPNAIRASLGTLFSLPVSAAATSSAALDWLRSQSLQIVAARVEGAVPYTEVDFTRSTAIVLGSEARGLSKVWRGEGITAASLPMLGAADSLNVSATAAVLFYEALRQRRVR